MSPLHGRVAYSPPRNAVSPTMPYASILPLSEPAMPPMRYTHMDQVTYMRHLEPMYPLRVPPHEMSHLEYTQMYEHAYRSYYANGMSYPVFRPTVIEKVFTYDEKPAEYVMEEVKEKERYSPIEDKPLNLCSKRLECKPIEDLVKRTDLPLDLSTKS